MTGPKEKPHSTHYTRCMNMGEVYKLLPDLNTFLEDLGIINQLKKAVVIDLLRQSGSLHRWNLTGMTESVELSTNFEVRQTWGEPQGRGPLNYLHPITPTKNLDLANVFVVPEDSEDDETKVNQIQNATGNMRLEPK